MNLFFKRTLTTQTMIFGDAIMISRFIFIFVLKNPSAFQDDFWSLFGNIWALSFCWIGQIVSEAMLGCENTNVNICSGKNILISEECQHFTRNDRFNGTIVCFSVILHIFVLVKIQIFKLDEPEALHSLQKAKISWRNFRESNLFPSLIQNTINSMVFISMAVAPHIMKKFTFSENQDYFYDIFTRLVRIPLTTLVLLTNYFFFNQNMFRQIFKEFRNCLRKLAPAFVTPIDVNCC